MSLTKLEKDALTQALTGMLNNWHDDWQHGHLDEEEQQTYQRWQELREKINK
jgi:hypothetical protein